MKSCTRKECAQINPQVLSNFRPRKLSSGRSGLTSHCRACHAETNKKYVRANRTQNAAGKKAWWNKQLILNPNKGKDAALKHKYGITYAQKEQLWLNQDKTCAICPRILPTLRSANVDHNHKTGEVRKLLCYPCNMYLGAINENMSIAINLAKYIQDHNKVDVYGN